MDRQSKPPLQRPVLTKHNYETRMIPMILAEMRHNEIELKKHDKENVILHFERDEDGKACLTLEVEGLPDGQPSVTEGSSIKVSATQIKWLNTFSLT